LEAQRTADEARFSTEAHPAHTADTARDARQER